MIDFQIDFPANLLSAVQALSNLRPGLKKHAQERLVLSRALRQYRTPSNHHLRRALRLSWIRAATTVVEHRLEWAGRNPSSEPALRVVAFQSRFDIASKKVLNVACNQDSGEDIGASPIDASLDELLEYLPHHLMGQKLKNGVANFGTTLSELTGWKIDELPEIILEDGREGIALDGGEHRNFGQLLFDEFARVIQDPTYYPEAGTSFHAVQQGALKKLMASLKEEVSNELPDKVAARVVQEVLARLENDLLARFMENSGGTISKKDGIFGPHQDQLGQKNLATADWHTPAQDRTVCFAGYRNLRGGDHVFDGIADQLSRQASRLTENETIVPMTWDFTLSATRETDRGGYARTDAWATLNNRIVGGVLILSKDLGPAIDSDSFFLDSVAARDWLAPKGPVADVLGRRPVELHASYQTGGIPITYESRFALECLIRGKPLLVVAPESLIAGSKPLLNLLKFLQKQGITCITYTEAEGSTAWADDFLSSLPGVMSDELPNPYRGLDYYQISDAESFVGRDPETAHAVTLLREAVEEKRGLLLGVTGPSGSGKSSFLRARVAAQAMKELSLTALELRPTDFRVPEEAKIRCLPHLCAKIAALIGVEAPGVLVGTQAIPTSGHLPRFKTWLDRAIKGGNLRPILICLDQFEEILDDLTEGVHEGEWRALTDVVTYLAQIHGWPVVFTLEDSRKDRFERMKDSLGFGDSRMLELHTDTAFYRKIIIQPFQDARIDLDSGIVQELLDEVDAQRKHATTSSSSPLPLLALRLYTLFRELSPRAPKAAQRSSLVQEFSRLLVTRADLHGTSLALGDVIADLAETAWVVGCGGNEADDLGTFLRPLVRISFDPHRPEEAKLVLQSVRGRGYRNEQLLQAEFRRRRVLVPSEGGLRLVHEAVIRRWPRARAWFEEARAELEKEATFRADALRWLEEGEPLFDTEAAKEKEEDMGLAVRILAANLRDWSPAERPHLDAEIEVLRRYAIEVFRGSRTPGALVKPNRPSGTHVHLAASYGLNDHLKTFLEIDSNCVNLTSKEKNRTPLMNAAWGHLSTVELLLEAGADPQARDNDGFCSLDAAVWAGRADIVEVILKRVNPEDWGSNRHNPLIGAAGLGRIDIAEMLTTRGFRHDQPTPHNRTPLHQAAMKDNLKNFQYFLRYGNLAARWATEAKLDERNSVQGKEEGNASWNRSNLSTGLTPLHIAAANGCQAIVSHILSLEEGFALLEDPGEGETPFMLAAWHHRYHLVTQLLAVTENPNHVSTRPRVNGYNALHLALAAYHSNPEEASAHLKRTTRGTVEALLQSPDIDVMAKTADGKTAWQMASGLAEVQRAIAAHPRASVEALKQFREEEALEELREALFDAVLNNDKAKFSATFAAIEPGVHVDIQKSVDGESEFLGNLMIDRGWISELTELIASGGIDPWRSEAGYPGLYGDAIEKGAEEVIISIERTMPETIPGRIMRRILLAFGNAGAQIDARDPTIRDKVVSRISGSELNEMLFYSARMGDAGIYERLMAKGADPTRVDGWGRTAMNVASEALRMEMGLLTSIGADAGLGGNSVFHPDDEGWHPLDALSSAEVLRSSGLSWDGHLVCLGRALPFYPDSSVRLIRVKNLGESSPNQFFYWLKDGEKVFRLNGSSPPIHEFNAKHTPELSGKRAMEYLEFFCFFVRGKDGPFYLIDGRDAPYLPESCKGKIDSESICSTAFRRVYRAPQHFGITDDGKHRISALMYYSNAMFIADFLVHPSGMVEMLADWPVASGLPDKIDAPI
jgi:ankyrin repeat protein